MIRLILYSTTSLFIRYVISSPFQFFENFDFFRQKIGILLKSEAVSYPGAWKSHFFQQNTKFLMKKNKIFEKLKRWLYNISDE